MNGLRQNNPFPFLQLTVIGPCPSVKAYKKSPLKTLSQTCLKMQTSLVRDSMATALFNSIHSQQ